MANISAVSSNGISTVYLKANGDGTDTSPYVPLHQLDENAEVLVKGGNVDPVLVRLEDQLNGYATEQTSLATSTLLGNINTKLPVLINGRVPVEVTTLSLEMVQANLIIDNPPESPVPVAGAVTVSTSELDPGLKVDAKPATGYQSFRTQTLTSVPVQVKNAAGSLHAFNFINVNQNSVYVKFFDKLATDVVVGVDAPKFMICVPPGDNIVPGIYSTDPNPIPFEEFETAISIAAMDDIADTSDSSPTSAIYAFVRFF
jgi:hypothetical protein